jgi:hypothetical protein
MDTLYCSLHVVLLHVSVAGVKVRCSCANARVTCGVAPAGATIGSCRPKVTVAHSVLCSATAGGQAWIFEVASGGEMGAGGGGGAQP